MSPQSAPPPCTVTNVTTARIKPPVCTVGPFVSVNGGIGVDRSGNLWVPDMGANPKTVTEYGPDCGAAKTVLSDPGDVGPDNVAFDTNGHVYVSNSFANSGGPGNILQYNRDVNDQTLSDPDIATPQGLAVDHRNNVWVSYRDPGSTGTYVAEFRRGNMPAKLFKNISLGFPGSLQFDRKQNLLAVDDNFFGHGHLCSAVHPEHTDNSTYLGETVTLRIRACAPSPRPG